MFLWPASYLINLRLVIIKLRDFESYIDESYTDESYIDIEKAFITAYKV